jgi:N6-adenosine-specific RNA methylase IME4
MRAHLCVKILGPNQNLPSYSTPLTYIWNTHTHAIIEVTIDALGVYGFTLKTIVKKVDIAFVVR